MGLRVAFQMDPIDGIDIKGDSTFALLLEAQQRGYEIFYYTPHALSMRDGKISAYGADISVADEEGKHFTLQNERRVDLGTYDAVLLRQDPPFDMHYITTTHLLERIHKASGNSLGGNTLVVNDPAHVRNAPEKIFVTEFPDLMPPTLITSSMDEVQAFRAEYRDIIIKPLYGNGGAGVFRLSPQDTNLASLVEMFEQLFREAFIVQQYLPAVRAGDKRIILVDGEIAGAINRVPAENETRSNMHVGGRPEPIDITEREREICARLEPELKRRGLLFTGIDVIGDYITEINVTSPTGIREVKRFGGNDIAAMLWDKIAEKVAS